MDELFSIRLTELIKSGSHTLDDIAEVTGKKAATISRYASGEIKGVKRSTIMSIANFFGVSPAWLAGLSNEKYNTKTTRIPILSKIDISNILAQENIIDYISIKINNNWSDLENCFAIASPDDDMLPVLGEGDLAIIHIQNKIDNKNTALFYLKDEKRFTIKKLIETKEGVELLSMNPTVEEIPTNYDNLIIIGRVIKADVEKAFE
ncbi:MAG: helix-turn-helix domain-containing protein [Clostridia bacterium]